MGRENQGRRDSNYSLAHSVLTLHLHSDLGLKRNRVVASKGVRAITLLESFGTSYSTKGWVEVCAPERHVKTGCGDVTWKS